MLKIYPSKLLKFLVFISLPLLSIAATSPKIYEVMGKNGLHFQHFEFLFSYQNTVLPRDSRLESLNRFKADPLDEKSDNFKYGQFEVFIPVATLNLHTSCKKFYIVRMPQTLNIEEKAKIEKKQNLFLAIQKAVRTKKGSVKAIIDNTESAEKYSPCNLYFRSNSNGDYVDYVGRLRS